MVLDHFAIHISLNIEPIDTRGAAASILYHILSNRTSFKGGRNTLRDLIFIYLHTKFCLIMSIIWPNPLQTTNPLIAQLCLQEHDK